MLARVFIASLFGRRLATALSMFAIALGVALGLAVQLIHGAALHEFGRGMRLLTGEADLQVVGPRGGFDEDVYVRLARHPAVERASPVLEVEARLPGRDETLKVFGIDLFRVAGMTPALLPVSGGGDEAGEREAHETDEAASGGQRFAPLRGDRIFLSAAARARLGLVVGEVLTLQSGVERVELEIAGSIPAAPAGQAYALIDIAAAQEHFRQPGVLTRVDLRLRAGFDREQAHRLLTPLLPAGVVVLAPDVAGAQVSELSRAYRVNLTMLAAIALFTGGFLVFSTQWLAVMRRRQEFALMRAMGLERATLVRGVVVEGAVLGAVGAGAGLVLAHALTVMAFRFLGGDLGAGFFSGVAPPLQWMPWTGALYFALGVAAGMAGAWLPARAAAQVAPARGLRSDDGVESLVARSRHGWVSSLLIFAALLCLPGPLAGIPVFGYLAIALVLVAAVLLLPAAVGWTMRLSPLLHGVPARLACLRLSSAPGQAVVAGAGVVASVALAVSMAIMVSSFRISVDDWLATVLPSDLYLRASSSSASGFLEPGGLAAVSEIDGVRAVEAVRYDRLRIDAGRPPVTLVARPVHVASGLPLVDGALDASGTVMPAWVSEAVLDLYGVGTGDALDLPLGGSLHRFVVAGVWRDYARQHGAVVIELEHYRAITGDLRANDAGLRLAPGSDTGAIMRALRTLFDEDTVEIRQPAEIRAITLSIFDRTFFVTYLMQAVAVMIGLFGISSTFAALASARRKEFGMLRHLGLRRAEIGRLLALEGGLTAAVGVCVGVAAGGAIAWILVEVVNRQSFHWSMDMHWPWGLLAGFAVTLVALAAVAARVSGHQAMRGSAVAAVREDW